MIEKCQIKQYRHNDIGPDMYRKVGMVWAQQAQRPGLIRTKKRLLCYRTGDWLVYTDQTYVDGCVLPNEVFRKFYREEGEYGRSCT